MPILLKTYHNTEESARPNKHLAKYLSNEMSPLTSGNAAHLLINGEENFRQSYRHWKKQRIIFTLNII